MDFSRCTTTEECLRHADAWLSAAGRTKEEAISLADAITAKTSERVEIVSSSLGILMKEGAVLLLHRSPALRSFADRLSFPGGKYESQDPDLAHTAIREMRQETGLDTKPVRLHSTRYTTESERKRIFHMEFWMLELLDESQKLQLSDEHSKAVWAFPQEILTDPKKYPLAGTIILQDILRRLV